MMASEHVRRQSELVVRLDGSAGAGRGLFTSNALLLAGRRAHRVLY